MSDGRWRPAAWCAAGILFVVLATANGGGYRYATSDQAFYIPAIVRVLVPEAFPRDAALIDAQARLMVFDEIAAALVRLTGLSLDTLFLAGYLLTLALVWMALVLIGTRVFSSPWAIVALGAAFTLRHRIPRTSANSFEPYLHPRMIAFALGLLALAAVLRRRMTVAFVLVAGAVVIHLTTALWWTVVLAVATGVLDVRARRLLVFAAPAVLIVAILVAASGLLAAPMARMDETWLTAVASKDSLFPSDWPLWAWAANLALPAMLWMAHRARAARGAASEEDRAVVWGGLALAGVFLATLPLVLARWALPAQFQISRVFWLLDVLALLYVLALLLPPGAHRRARIVAAVLVSASVARGAYVMLVEFPSRPLVRTGLANSDWHDAMEWISTQPIDVHVLADPGHAWKYGTSVRASAGRDTLLEDTKDTAVAIYSRDVALRVNERAGALRDFDRLTAERAAALAQQYDLDFLVTEQPLALPVAYRSGKLVVYRLDPGSPTGDR